MGRADICIAGAGIIGLSLALELSSRGAQVTVIDRGTPLMEASSAAAGMLAAYDPENPAALLPLSELSLSLYPRFLHHLFELSGEVVPLHTSTTLRLFQRDMRRWRGSFQFLAAKFCLCSCRSSRRATGAFFSSANTASIRASLAGLS